MAEPKVNKPTYIMVPRKLITTWIASVIFMLILIGGGILWSNSQWCGVIEIFNETYKYSPPPTATGQRLAAEFKKMDNRFLCS